MSLTDTSYHPRIFGGWGFTGKREAIAGSFWKKEKVSETRRALVFISKSGCVWRAGAHGGLTVFIRNKDLSTAL